MRLQALQGYEYNFCTWLLKRQLLRFFKNRGFWIFTVFYFFSRLPMKLYSFLMFNLVWRWFYILCSWQLKNWKNQKCISLPPEIIIGMLQGLVNVFKNDSLSYWYFSCDKILFSGLFCIVFISWQPDMGDLLYFNYKS